MTVAEGGIEMWKAIVAWAGGDMAIGSFSIREDADTFVEEMMQLPGIRVDWHRVIRINA